MLSEGPLGTAIRLERLSFTLGTLSAVFLLIAYYADAAWCLVPTVFLLASAAFVDDAASEIRDSHQHERWHM